MMFSMHLRSDAQLTSVECNKDFQGRFPDDHYCGFAVQFSEHRNLYGYRMHLDGNQRRGQSHATVCHANVSLIISQQKQ